MEYTIYDHRHAKLIVDNDEDYSTDYNEIINAIESITDENLQSQYHAGKAKRKDTKSLSDAINYLLKERLIEQGWNVESALFKEPPYDSKRNKSRWRLDFAKNKISVEVAFNHQEATAHNIMKPVLASELNHVKKDVQTRLGIIITATSKMKKFGNFDGSIGTFEKFIEYFKPYNVIITTPFLLIGLNPPKTFYIDKKTRLPVLKEDELF